MRNLYFLILSLFLYSSYTYAQGNLPFEYLGIEYEGVIYNDPDTINICSTEGQLQSLSAEYLPIGLVGDDYNVFSIPFTDIYPLTANDLGGGVSINLDDTFSDIVTIPFDFSFFGNVYNQLVVGANGRILFDTSFANSYDAWSLDIGEYIPTPSIEGNSIMGVYQDININDNSVTVDAEFSYGIYGDAPFRALVVNYKLIPLFGSCDSFGGQTYQMVLHEGTSAIDIIIHKRDSCPNWNDGLGVVGIQNANSTVAVFPSDRNTGTWEVEEGVGEAWRFVPTTGGYDAATTIEWFVNGVSAGDDTTINVELDSDTEVELEVSYYLNVTDTIATASTTLFFDVTTLNIEQGDSLSICPGDLATLSTVETYDTYQWYKDDAILEGETSQTLDITEPGNYAVEYVTPDCTAKDEIVVFNPELPIINPIVENVCDSGPEMGTEIVDISPFESEVVNYALEYTVSYYANETDATNGTNPLDPLATELVTGDNVIFVAVEYSTSCIEIGSFTLVLNEEISLEPVSEDICENDVTAIDLTMFNAEISPDFSSFSYFNSIGDAEADTNPLPDSSVMAFTPVLGQNVIYIKAVSDVGCTGITTITINVSANPSLLPVNREFCANEIGTTYDLTSEQSSHSADTSLSYSYYLSLEEAENDTNAIPESEASSYTITAGSNVFYVRAEDSNFCESITTLTIVVNENPTFTFALEENDLTITGTGTDMPYQYSLNGGAYQSSNQFLDLAPGDYTIYVQASNGCISIATFTLEPLEIEYIPSIITPNGDGYNDTWNIPGIQYFPGTVVTLYDRYGKRILDKTIGSDASDEVWNAMYLDEKLPSSTYWYAIKLPDGREFKGYLVVRNREKK